MDKRIKEIKRMWHEDGDINDETFYWLIQQAERAELLERENKALNDILTTLEKQDFIKLLDRLIKQNKRYREAINNINEKAMLFGTSEEVYDAIQDAIKILEGGQHE